MAFRAVAADRGRRLQSDASSIFVVSSAESLTAEHLHEVSATAFSISVHWLAPRTLIRPQDRESSAFSLLTPQSLKMQFMHRISQICGPGPVEKPEPFSVC